MNAQSARVFEAKPAIRQTVGLLIGLVGPSGGGKTYSALELATGIQRIAGGDIDLIDTENGRALYYADRFKFNHVDFRAPFGSIDYLDAVRYCAKRGAKTIIVDSASHEHDGVGGMIDAHEKELDRLAGNDYAKRERVKLLAWAKPKAARKRLINELLQLNVNLILTFRAKQKLRIIKGKEPEPRGWQPICGEEFMYEMVLQCLLPPGASGVPRWQSEYEDEQAMTKLPVQFREYLLPGGDAPPVRLDRDLGQKLADWAAGGVKASVPVDTIVADYAKCTSQAEFDALEKRRQALWVKSTPAAHKDRMAEASKAAKERLAPPAETTGPDPATWVSTLRGQTTIEELTSTWNSCCEAFSGNAPVDCDAAYQTRREELQL